MCKIGGGANRCDAHWGPAQKAADLAKRRAKYAASKGGNVRAYNKTDSSETVPLVATPVNNNILKTCEPVFDKDHHFFASFSDLDTWYSQQETIMQVESLGITQTEVTGKLVDNDYFISKQTEGVINWENLDENSYVEFGFQPMTEKRIWNNVEINRKNLSESELGTLTQPQLQSIRKFTSDDFQWINSALYNEGKAEEHSKNVVAESRSGQDVEMIMPYSETPPVERTKEMLQRVTEELDNTLVEKSPHQQRIVYRGLKQSTKAIKNAGGIEAYMENFKLGQEMIFDGYQSSSSNVNTAVSFSGSTFYNKEPEGVLFEIITSSGVNIEKESYFSTEHEVLLPRNARYMVVGVHKKASYPTEKADEHTPVANVVQLIEITETGAIANSHNRPASPPPLTEKQTRVKTREEIEEDNNNY